MRHLRNLNDSRKLKGELGWGSRAKRRLLRKLKGFINRQERWRAKLNPPTDGRLDTLTNLFGQRIHTIFSSLLKLRVE
jgi:hypothetical protein